MHECIKMQTIHCQHCLFLCMAVSQTPKPFPLVYIFVLAVNISTALNMADTMADSFEVLY